MTYANVQVSDLAYAHDIVILSSRYRKMQGLLEAVNRNTTTVGDFSIHPWPLEDVAKFKYLGSLFIANGQGTKEVRSTINLARYTFSRLQSCLWSRREISLRTRGGLYQAVVR